MTARQIYAHWFPDPLGNPRNDVYAEVEVERTVLRGFTSDEPPDVCTVITRASLNDHDAKDPDSPRWAPVVRYVMEHGQ